eukprot:11173925-Lingulodinium_polyedra.AAC.1
MASAGRRVEARRKPPSTPRAGALGRRAAAKRAIWPPRKRNGAAGPRATLRAIGNCPRASQHIPRRPGHTR